MQEKPRRYRLPRDERRLEILKTATLVFHEKGYDAASLQDIADRLGIKKASLFYYFPSKEELLYGVMSSIAAIGIDNLGKLLTDQADPLTKLWQMVVGHVRLLCESRIETAVFLHERKSVSAERQVEIARSDSAYQAAYTGLIREGQQTAQIRPDINPKLAALSILGSTNWIYAWYRPDGGQAPSFIAEQFAAMTINGLASDAALAEWRPPGTSSASNG